MISQKGFAHAFLIVGLVVAIIGALGFIFWQNFIHKETVATKTETQIVKEPVEKDQIYSNDILSFKFPSSGWKKVEKGYDDEKARIETDDFTPSIGMGLDKGAQLTISSTFQQEVPPSPGVKNVKEIRIDGNKAFEYELEYEGYRRSAFFSVNVETSDEKSYIVTMETVGKATTMELSAFDLVINTLHIK